MRDTSGSYPAKLAAARSLLAALADTATTIETATGYERVLLELDSLHSGTVPPATAAVPAASRDVLYRRARMAVATLHEHGTDALRLEICLGLLADVRDREPAP